MDEPSIPPSREPYVPASTPVELTPWSVQEPPASPENEFAQRLLEIQASAEREEPGNDPRSRFRRRMAWLLSLSLAAFILTIWILVRVQPPASLFSDGPLDVVRAQLDAVDHGDLRASYNLFSERYRAEVSFDAW